MDIRSYFQKTSANSETIKDSNQTPPKKKTQPKDSTQTSEEIPLKKRSPSKTTTQTSNDRPIKGQAKISNQKEPPKKRRIIIEAEEESSEEQDDFVESTNQKTTKKPEPTTKASVHQSPRKTVRKHLSKSSDNELPHDHDVRPSKSPKKVKVNDDESLKRATSAKRGSHKASSPKESKIDRHDSKMDIDEKFENLTTNDESNSSQITETPKFGHTSPKKKSTKTPAKQDLKPPFRGKRKSDETVALTENAKKKLAKDQYSGDFDPYGEEDEGESSAKTRTPRSKRVKTISRGKAATMQNNENPDADKPVKTTPQKGFYRFKQRTGPSAPGSKEIPIGAELCLLGMTFVFTGDLSSIDRDEAADLVKRYGGRITTAVSSKTSYVVLGDDPGATKIKAAEKHNTPKINEDEFLDLIRTSPPKTEPTVATTQSKRKMTEPAMLMEVDDSSTLDDNPLSSRSQMLVDKYKPTSLKELCGNKSSIEKLQDWLHRWEENLNGSFASNKGFDKFRAALISGPPGIGKTTAAHLVSKLEGFEVNEFNASDVRSQKILQMVVKLATTNSAFTNFYHINQMGESSSKRNTHQTLSKHGKSLIIMDEVDGMSSGDRGGIAELTQLIKKTQVPIICICNERNDQKIRNLASYCADIRFIRPPPQQIRSRIMTIAHRENLKLGAPIVDQLIKDSHTDIRQILNMLSAFKLTQNSMDWDQLKAMNTITHKEETQTIWDCIGNLFSPASWRRRNGKSIDEKIEFYFQDSSLLPLMVQENYLKPIPARTQSEPNTAPFKDAELAALELRWKAADSICDGDIIDSKIHSAQQHWSLMPLHAVMSCVRPASFIHGTLATSYGGGGKIQFPSWLGKTSTTRKYQRRLQDIHSHMRLKISGDKKEVRQSYMPVLFTTLSRPLVELGTDGVDEVIDRMNAYYLNREDWDIIIEMGLPPNDGNSVLSKIDTRTKTAFTRKYNQLGHKVPFIKTVAESAKAFKADAKAATTEVPDVEEAFLIDDVPDDEDTPSGDDDDLGKDANIKLRKPSAAKGKARTSSGSKNTSSNSRNSPKRGTTKGGARGMRGRGARVKS